MTGVSTRQFKSAFWDARISGAKGRCSLKISQVVENDQGLLMDIKLHCKLLGNGN